MLYSCQKNASLLLRLLGKQRFAFSSFLLLLGLFHDFSGISENSEQKKNLQNTEQLIQLNYLSL